MSWSSRLGVDEEEGELVDVDVDVDAAEGLAGGRGQSKLEDPLAEDDFSRVQLLQARRISDEQARIQCLSLQQCQELLGRCLFRDPSLIFDVMVSAPPPGPPVQDPNQPEWCVCMRCREMPTDVERKCCGQPPQNCISLLPHVDLYILHEGVLRLARRIWNDIKAQQDIPNPGEDKKQFRYSAYRQFVVWQYGAFGRGNRTVIPSCCVCRIRDRYPDPEPPICGLYPMQALKLPLPHPLTK